MLERFERHHDVDGRIGQRDRARIAGQKRQARPGIGTAGMLDGGLIELDTDNAAGRLGDECRAVALARRDIQHVQPAALFAREQIAMQVFVLDLSGHCGCHSLTAERQSLIRTFVREDLAHQCNPAKKIGP